MAIILVFVSHSYCRVSRPFLAPPLSVTQLIGGASPDWTNTVVDVTEHFWFQMEVREWENALYWYLTVVILLKFQYFFAEFFISGH